MLPVLRLILHAIWFGGAMVVCAAALVAASGCAPAPPAAPAVVRQPPALSAADMNNPISPTPIDGPVVLAAAKNETTSFVLQIANLPAISADNSVSLKIGPLQSVSGDAIGPANFSAFQVLPMPVDLNRASYVRQTGLNVAERQMPRALLPIKLDPDGRLDAHLLRDPAKPTDSSASAADTGASTLLWLDVKVPPDAKAGEYWSSCDLDANGAVEPLASVPVKLTVYNFSLPDQPHLAMVGRLDWPDLQRLYPDELEAITPAWINRGDARYAPAVRLLDQLQTLAQANRAEVVVPKLQPVTKWPSGQPPQIAWDDFDSLLSPWLNGDAFADKTPLEFWPLPPVDGLANFDPQSQLDYWTAASEHFVQSQWARRSAILFDSPTLETTTPDASNTDTAAPESAGQGSGAAADRAALCSRALQVSQTTRVIPVMLPLREDQLQSADGVDEGLLNPRTIDRLDCAAPGLVFSTPVRSWPTDLRHPRHWLRTDEPGLAPYVGAGADERDVRLWAWLAYLRRADLIQWGSSMPETSSPAESADPSQLTWFYPGSWFGVDEPVPTIQLKWLRRAQQDFEYLYLAEQRGMRINGLLLARLMTKPVQIQPNQSPDPVYALMSGTTDQQAWDQAMDLLARTILLREPGRAPDEAQTRLLDLETLRWEKPKERPFLLPRSVRWLSDGPDSDAPGNWISATVGIDIYNASDSTPDQDSLQWSPPPDSSGWQVSPQDVAIPPLQTFRVQRFDISARFNLDAITAASRDPLEVTFVDGDTRAQTTVKMVLPVAASDRIERQLSIDGRLGDWSTADAIQDGPMVKMIDRPTLQRQDILTASVPAQVFTGWADGNFYVAFKLTGITPEPGFGRNFVETQFRRAWGEDLCQILIQPVYPDNTLGPVLHAVCKPNGVVWVERRQNDEIGAGADDYTPFEGSGIRYAATTDGSFWRGEAAIPWSALLDPGHERPKLLRFNFIQHQTRTGETASWAGPIDFGRDQTLMGLIYLRGD